MNTTNPTTAIIIAIIGAKYNPMKNPNNTIIIADTESGILYLLAKYANTATAIKKNIVMLPAK